MAYNSGEKLTNDKNPFLASNNISNYGADFASQTNHINFNDE